MKKTKYYFILGSVALFAFIAGCGLIKSAKTLCTTANNTVVSAPWINTLGDSLGNKVSRKTEKLIVDMKDTMLDDYTQQRILLLADRLEHDLRLQIDSIRDSLMGPKTQHQIYMMRDSLLGRDTRELIAAMRDEVLGNKTRRDIDNIRNDLLGDSTLSKLIKFRNGLLDTAEIKLLIGASIRQAGQSYKTDISPQIISDIQKVINGSRKIAGEIVYILIIIFLILLATGAIIFVAARAARDRKALHVVTNQIYELGRNKSPAYDELTKKIHTQANISEIEGHLNKFLIERNLLKVPQPPSSTPPPPASAAA